MRRLLALALFATACTESADRSLIEPAGLPLCTGSETVTVPFAFDGQWSLDWYCGGHQAAGSQQLTECDPESSAVDDIAGLSVGSIGTVMTIEVGPYRGTQDVSTSSGVVVGFSSEAASVSLYGCTDGTISVGVIVANADGSHDAWGATATRR